MEQTLFQINKVDNVATALTDLMPGKTKINGEAPRDSIEVIAAISAGHKAALTEIPKGADIVKYGVIIGEATQDIAAGAWVHLHNVKSKYDARSSHLDARTGAPQDTEYL